MTTVAAAQESFRNFDDVEEAIKNNYQINRRRQTLNYTLKMKEKYLRFKHKMNINTVFEHLESFIDISDPDISLPNYYHGLQTAEAMRKDGQPEWLQLIGLIHDIGKIIYLWGCDADGTSIKQQWGIVGDTFIVGAKIPDKIVFPQFNKENPDMQHPVYSTKLGIYEEHCGLDAVHCAWGHDEYLYQVLKNCRECKINEYEEALYIIRFHSLYSYHKEGEYDHFVNEKDREMFKWLKLFNQYDLYTKTDDDEVVKNKDNKNKRKRNDDGNDNGDQETGDDTKNYYQKLIDKYLNGGDLYF